MKIHQNFDLSALNTLGVPCTAEYYIECSSKEDVLSGLRKAKKEAATWRILAGGSNVVLREILEGYTLNPKLTGIKHLDNDKVDSDTVLVRVAAGENWHTFVEHCVNQGWYGLENLAWIPGTVGAAPIQNIGAYGVEIESFIQQVNVINADTLEYKSLHHADCKFSYRDSLFKKAEGEKYVVLSVDLNLSKSLRRGNASYPALTKYLNEMNLPATPENIFNAVIAIRKSKLPDPDNFPNAGSFFKNPLVSAREFARLSEQFPGIPHYPTKTDDVKIPAAWIIEKLGWKGKKINGIGMHVEHALVLVNHEGKSAQEIKSYAENIVKDAKNTFGILLDQEPRNLE